jgi:vacuolar protein-sorting-associated protein 4
MRRRFEKRVYIPLPELHARNRMIKLNLGDTPHTINDQQLELLASKTEGFSGSDIAILVRDAIMAPLRKCQSAKQFSMDNQGFFYPLEEYPNCPRCPISLSYLPSVVGVQCSYCQAIRNTLYDIPSGKLKEPKVTFEDFNKSLERAHASVAISELDRFISWTETFGQEG